MKVTDIKAIAKSMDIKPGKMRKAELILAIQEAEGNFPCFGTAEGSCDQIQCIWREDCLA